MKSPKITSHNAAAQLKSLEAALLAYKRKNQAQRAKLDGNTPGEVLMQPRLCAKYDRRCSPERHAGSYKKATEVLIEKCKVMIAEFEVEPVEAVAEAINGRVLTRFSNGWVTHGTAVEAKEATDTADMFPSLRDAAQDIIDQVEDVASKSNFSYSQLKWKVDCDGGPLKISHLLALRDWLVGCDLMVANIQRKPAPLEKKVPVKPKAIKILVDGKLVTMNSKMFTMARNYASMYPGCVENGMEAVKAVLTNRNGREKCISCVPQRGGDGDDKLANHRLALNPDILKVIGGAIKVASGHDIDTLLTPEVELVGAYNSLGVGALKLKETMDLVSQEE
ncbi:hypothetical protein C8R44DRAFT_864393 [Mycena epipterygia]|nr:hypothetical protein C8R44DRAFT_864393 [Mycena epipterygia]